MQAQAQFTIHSLNDVVASTTAPSSPYKGQLWVDTSYSPPRTFVYNGSASRTAFVLIPPSSVVISLSHNGETKNRTGFALSCAKYIELFINL